MGREPNFKRFGSKRYEFSGGIPRTKREAESLAKELRRGSDARGKRLLGKRAAKPLLARVTRSESRPKKWVVYVRRK